jgi:acetyl-CoA C-acetyltransferase
MSRDVFVVSGVRTPIGDYGGSLKGFAPTELGAMVVREAVRRASVDPSAVDHVVFGNVIHTEAKDMYLSRVAAIGGGLSIDTPALTVNRLCGSGLQAVVSATQMIGHGDADIVVAGGAECMSRGLHASPATRWGSRMGNATLIDMMVGALTDPFDTAHMGVTAENVASKYAISRDRQDEFALQSHMKAAAAQAEGRFQDQILPVKIASRRQEIVFDKDEHVRANLSMEDLQGLRPAFQAENGTVTPGNASPINDGAAALTLMSEAGVKNAGAAPALRIVGYAHSGVDPKFMGIGPVPAVRKLLGRTGVRPGDIAVIESNEAFASQSCAVIEALELDPATVNPNGGAIALGHPIGATGAILVVKLMYELQRVKGRYGLVTLCIGGGQGIAVLFERVE